MRCSHGFKVVCSAEAKNCLNGSSGLQYVTCLNDGTWEPYAFVCEASTCPSAPTVPLHGRADMTKGVYGDVAALTCESGFVVNCLNNIAGSGSTSSCESGQLGSQLVLCDASGQWEPHEYECDPVPCLSAPTLPVHGTSDTTMGFFGDVALLACEAGYVGFQSVVCLASGEWSPTNYTCRLSNENVTCDTAPMIPPHGLSSTSTGKYGSAATLTCEAGYTGSQTVVCGATGSWSPTTYTCLPVSCGPPPVVKLPQILTCTGNTFGSVCTSSCTGTQNVLGTRNFTCGSDGRWSSGCFRCTRKFTLILPAKFDVFIDCVL